MKQTTQILIPSKKDRIFFERETKTFMDDLKKLLDDYRKSASKRVLLKKQDKIFELQHRLYALRATVRLMNWKEVRDLDKLPVQSRKSVERKMIDIRDSMTLVYVDIESLYDKKHAEEILQEARAIIRGKSRPQDTRPSKTSFIARIRGFLFNIFQRMRSFLAL